MIDDDTQKECICVVARKMRDHLGTEIVATPNIQAKDCAFYKDSKFLTDTNLFIKSWWADFLPHLKFSLVCMGTRYRFKIVTDEMLKVVFVGAESYQQRSKSTRDNVETYNSLSDVVGRTADLIILRLGFLGYPNKAMPGALKEALMIRESLHLPTWIVESPNSIFDYNHLSWSSDLDEYIKERFRVIEIEGAERHLPNRGIVEEFAPSRPADPLENDVALTDVEPDEPPAPRSPRRYQSKYKAKPGDKHGSSSVDRMDDKYK